MRRLILLLPLVVAAACGGSVTSSDDNGSGGGGSSVGACNDYIDCVTAVSPGSLGDVLGAYGTSGSCWQNLPAEQCREACSDGMSMLHDAFPNEPLCGATMNVGGGGGGGGGCAIADDYFFSLVLKQSPKKPAPFVATLTTADGANGVVGTLSMQPLNADDRTTMVSAAFTLGPFPINADGTYDLDWGTVTIPGETNPISASELTANVQTSGSLCGPLACGVANGLVTSPVMLPIDGSAWTMERMSLFVEPPKVNCAGDLADPL